MPSPLRHLLTAAVLAIAAPMTPASADVILDWNAVTTETIVNNWAYQNPGMSTRTMAMVNLAMYDAFAMTDPGGTMYYDYGGGNASPGYVGSPKAAAAVAAHAVLTSVYPEQSALLDARLATSLAGIADDAEKAMGVSVGQMVGSSIANHRHYDGHDKSSQYVPSGQPGGWSPDPMNPSQEAWGPSWGEMPTFMAPHGMHTVPPPPAIDSAEYAAAYNEVKSLGAADSTTRTAEQTEIGHFWAYDRVGTGSPPVLYNEILRTLAVQQGNTDKQNAQMFAKASVAMADAGMLSWESKFEYDYWRPVVAIREGDADGNALTEGDDDWVPLGAPGGMHPDGETVINNFTPPFPAYVSGHATFGAAAMHTMALFFGDDNIPFTVASVELPGVERSFNSFSEAIAENGRSRVYLGIHWNFDDIEGQALGRSIAEYVFTQPFTSSVMIPEPSSLVLVAVGLLGFARRR
ncbi:phosphatase PAP2 family protein [Botrimarina mediterranea]|uniref:PAP2 superfamily protein n=1 Tax=Botrimarina mediterranea TaxID=2528022 RepID=A0A518K6V5_9BACT|nr:phosphatase PAP2 family protein [Botrimarina mediterranea]QDV73516.1 PAP2 superfamily protein [Botrimarina mediterranea]